MRVYVIFGILAAIILSGLIYVNSLISRQVDKVVSKENMDVNPYIDRQTVTRTNDKSGLIKAAPGDLIYIAPPREHIKMEKKEVPEPLTDKKTTQPKIIYEIPLDEASLLQ